MPVNLNTETRLGIAICPLVHGLNTSDSHFFRESHYVLRIARFRYFEYALQCDIEIAFG